MWPCRGYRCRNKWWFYITIAVIINILGRTTTHAYDFDWYCPQYQQSASQTKRNLICPTQPKKKERLGVGDGGGGGNGSSSTASSGTPSSANNATNNSNSNNKRSAGTATNSKNKNKKQKDKDDGSSSTVTSQVLQWNGSGPGGILQQPAEFYRSNEAKRIAETIMSHQHSNGGWHKHYNRIHQYTPQELRQMQYKFQIKEKQDISYTQQHVYKTTIDNGVTTTEIQFLALVAYEHRQKYGSNGNTNGNFNSFTQQKLQLRYQQSIIRGIEFLLKSQYTNNGGWPQIYPPPKTTNDDGSSYPKHITYNDKAMINVMNLLYDIIVENQQVQAFQRQKEQEQLHRYDDDRDDKSQQQKDKDKNDDEEEHEELKLLYPFLSSCYHHYIEEAVEKGIQTLLDTQIVIGGGRPPPPSAKDGGDRSTTTSSSILKDDKMKLGGWCQQHNLVTLEPVQGRTFEPPSISGGVESLTIIQFLMKLPNPTPRIIKSIEHAIQWYDSSIIQNIQYECYYDTNEQRNDKRVISYSNSRIRRYDENGNGDYGGHDEEDDSTTPLPLWARFYDMYDGKTPIFQDRDGTIYLDQQHLSYERRFGYTWYSDAPNTLFCNDYPQWKMKIQSLQSKQQQLGESSSSSLQLQQPIIDDTNDNINNSPFDDSPFNKKHQSKLDKNAEGCPPLPNNDSTLYATDEDYISIYAISSSSSLSFVVTNTLMVVGFFVVWSCAAFVM